MGSSESDNKLTTPTVKTSTWCVDISNRDGAAAQLLCAIDVVEHRWTADIVSFINFIDCAGTFWRHVSGTAEVTKQQCVCAEQLLLPQTAGTWSCAQDTWCQMEEEWGRHLEPASTRSEIWLTQNDLALTCRSSNAANLELKSSMRSSVLVGVQLSKGFRSCLLRIRYMLP